MDEKKEPKFFFEEDARASNTDRGLSWEEHADSFGNAIDHKIDSLKPMSVQIDHELKEMKNGVILLEYGRSMGNYAIHYTPIHPKKNLREVDKFNQAIRSVTILLNEVVPQSIQVNIIKPQPEAEIKATSFVIQKIDDAWNFDVASVEGKMKEIFDALTEICVK